MRLVASWVVLLVAAGCANQQTPPPSDIQWADAKAPSECMPEDGRLTTGTAFVYTVEEHMLGSGPGTNLTVVLRRGADGSGTVLQQSTTDDRGCASLTLDGAGDFTFEVGANTRDLTGRVPFHWNGTWVPQVRLGASNPYE